MKSTLQFWLNQWTQTLLTSADIGYMCHSVLYISIGQAQDMSFSVASLPSLSLFQSRQMKKDTVGRNTRPLMRPVPAGTQAQQEIGTYKADLQTLQKVPARYLQIYVAMGTICCSWF